MNYGIVSYGAYLARHRVSRAAIRESLGPGGGKGTRSVAGYDEDTTSMGVEAARKARWNGSFAPASLHFATTAPAYADKTNATAVHAALGLDRGVFATDHASSVRSAVGALRAAAADGGLAVLSAVRTGRPGSADEAGGGDGAAAFLFGTGQAVVAEVVGQASATAEFLDRWRAPGEDASSLWEERFGFGIYLPLIQDVAGRALAAAGVERPDHVVIASPHTRAARAAAQAFGDAAGDGVEPVAGHLGAAPAGVQLAEGLRRARRGRRHGAGAHGRAAAHGVDVHGRPARVLAVPAGRHRGDRLRRRRAVQLRADGLLARGDPCRDARRDDVSPHVHRRRRP